MPTDNSYGLFSDKSKSTLSNIFDKEICDDVNMIVHDKYSGEMIPNSAFIMKRELKDGKFGYLCICCIARTPSEIRDDFAFMTILASLRKINRYVSKNKMSGSKKFVFANMELFGNNSEHIAHQILMAFGDHLLIDSYSKAEARNEEIMTVPVFELVDIKKDLVSMIFSKELEGRGIYDSEIDALIELITDDFLPAGILICNVLNRPLNINSCTLSPFEISKAITTNPDCLEKLINWIVTEKIAFSIEQSDLIYGDMIGEGKTSHIYKGFYRENEVAIKKLKWGNNHKELLRELALLSVVKNEVVIAIYGSFINSEDGILIMEKMEGSLYEILHCESFKMDEEIKLLISLKTAMAMKYFHLIGLIHRDLKSLNILISATFNIKLCDYGISRISSKNQMTIQNVGTISWIAPEIFRSKKYTQMADVYSFGIIMWEIQTREDPYSDLEAFMIPMHVGSGKRPDSKCIPSGFRKLMKRAWHSNDEKRPSFSKIVRKLTSLYKIHINHLAGIGVLPRVVSSIRRTNNPQDLFDINYETGELTMTSNSTSNDDQRTTCLYITPTPENSHQQMIDLIFSQLEWENGNIDVEEERFVVIPTSSLSSSLYENFLKLIDFIPNFDKNIIEHNLDALVYEIGHVIGKSDSIYILSLFPNELPETHISMMKYYIEGMGWGRFEIEQVDEISWLVSISESFTDYHFSRCTIIEGYLSGYFNGIGLSDYLCFEFECDKTTASCQFLVFPKSKKSKMLAEYGIHKDSVPHLYILSASNWFKRFMEKYQSALAEPEQPSKKKRSRTLGRKYRNSKRALSVSLLPHKKSQNTLSISRYSKREKSLNLNNALILDRKSGIFSLLDKPVLIIRSEALSSIRTLVHDLYPIQEIKDIFSDLFMFNFGKIIGSDIQKISQSEDHSFEEILLVCGWGPTKSQENEKDNLFSCRVYDSFEFNRKSTTVGCFNCSITPGLFSGYHHLEQHFPIETECQTDNGHYCNFIIPHQSKIDRLLRNDSMRKYSDEALTQMRLYNIMTDHNWFMTLFLKKESHSTL